MSDYNPGFPTTSDFGPRPHVTTGSRYHRGVDYGAPDGTNIPAASDGVVVFSGFHNQYGNVVVIQSISGSDPNRSYFTLYAHQNGQDMPSVNDVVFAGQSIGQVGSTGVASGAHLHFEVLPETDSWTFEAQQRSDGSWFFNSRGHQVDPTEFDDEWFGGEPHGGDIPLSYKEFFVTAVPVSYEGFISESYLDPSSGDILTRFEDAATAVINGIEYVVKEIAISFEKTANAVAQFISEQAGIGTEWYRSVNSQTVVSSWLAANIGELLEGNLSAEDALIGLAREYGEQYISGFVSASVTNAVGAKGVLSKVFQDTFGVDAKLANRYANSIEGAIARIAVEFVLEGFDAEQAFNAGASYLASQVTATYLDASGLVSANTAGSAAASTAAATAIVGLLNSGDFDSSDWVQLGVQVGVASGAAAAGPAISAAIGFTTGGPAAVATAVVAFFASRVISSIYQGKVFNEGEFPSAVAALGSIYQVQTIEVDGEQVPALVAVNANGATIIASGTGIGYIIGNTGEDVLVGDDEVQTIVGNGGADYLESNGGDDNLLGGNILFFLAPSVVAERHAA